MALRKIVVDTAVSEGLAGNIDPHVMDAPQTFCENVYFDKDGTLQKRYGDELLGPIGADSTAGPNAIFSLNNAVGVYGPDGFSQTISSTPSNYRTSSYGTPKPVLLSSKEVIGINEEVSGPHACKCGNYIVYVCNTGETTLKSAITIRRIDNGAVVLPTTYLGNSIENPRCVATSSSTFLVFGKSGTDLVVRAFSSIPTSITISGTVTTITAMDPYSYDVDEHRSNGAVYVAMTATGTYAVSVFRVTQSGDSTSKSVAANPDSGLLGLCVMSHPDSGSLFVATISAVGANVKVSKYAQDLSGGAGSRASILTPLGGGGMRIAMGSTSLAATGYWLLVSSASFDTAPNPDEYNSYITEWRKCDSSNAVVATTSGFLYGYRLEGKGFVPEGDTGGVFPVAYMGMASGSTGGEGSLQHTGFLLNLTTFNTITAKPGAMADIDGNYDPAAFPADGNGVPAARPIPVAKFSVNKLFPHVFIPSGLPRPVRTSTYNFLMPVVEAKEFGAYQTLLSTGQDTVFTYGTKKLAIREIRFDFQPKPLRSCLVNDTVFFPGAMPAVYDGTVGFEATPQHYPEVIALHGRATIPGSTSDTSYEVAFVYSWTDNKGNVYRSAPSTPLTVSSGDTISHIAAIVADPNYHLTSRIKGWAGKVTTECYRTLNIDAHGTNQMRRHPEGLSGTMGSGGIKLTLTEIGSGWHYMTMSGANQVGYLANTLYTEAGELESGPTHPMLDIIATKQRLFAINAERRNQIHYTKILTPPYAPEWNDFLVLVDPVGDQEFTALAPLDDKVICFKKDSIQYFYGEGPNNSGEGAGFSQLQTIPAGVGTENRNSVCETPLGVAFLGKRGFYLLGRDMNPVFIGGPVENITTSAGFTTSSINSAVHVPRHQEVRWLLTTTGTVATNCLVWNYEKNKWSKNTWFGGRHATMWNGKYVRLRQDTTPYAVVDLTTTFASWEGRAASTNHYRQKISSPRIFPAGKGGKAKVKKILIQGQQVGTGNLLINYNFAKSDNTTGTETVSFVNSTNITSGRTFTLEFAPATRNISYFTLDFFESTAGTLGKQGFKIFNVRTIALVGEEYMDMADTERA